MLNNEVLFNNIKSLCEQKGIKITNLEKELGFGGGIISRWGNDADPSLSKIMLVAKYFHVSIDDVIGYGYIVDDKFLEKLILQTTNKTIKWKDYSNEDDKKPKQHFGFDIASYDFIDQAEIDCFFNTHKELSFYCDINGRYISIYGYYDYHNILNPKEITLFIQPALEAELIEQNYSYEQLKILWLKVIYSMGKKAPDEIKVEEFKNDFINTPENLTDEKINDILANPSIMNIIETVDTKEFLKIQEMFENPEFKAGLQMLNNIQNYLNRK